jgi:hypothetical protein
MAYTASCGSHLTRFIVVNIAGPKEPTFLLANNLNWLTLSCVFTDSVRHYCICALERGILLNMPFINCSSDESLACALSLLTHFAGAIFISMARLKTELVCEFVAWCPSSRGSSNPTRLHICMHDFPNLFFI